MIDTVININNGVEAFGTTAKTITLVDRPKEISTKFFAEELQHKMPLVPVEVIEQVLSGFGDVAARMMAEGFAIRFTDSKDNVLMRIFADARLKCQSINLAKAKELMPDDVTDEASMVAHAGELVALAGVTLRPYVEVQQKFHELLAQHKPHYQVKDIVDRPYIAKREGEGTTAEPEQGGGTGTGGSDNQGGSGDNSGGGGDNSGLE